MTTRNNAHAGIDAALGEIEGKTYKHSPTPWVVAASMLGIGGEHVEGVRDCDGMGIANCGNGEHGKANAARIALCVNAHDDLVSALEATEARLTAAARAFYVGGKPSALRAALDGWKADAEAARAVIAKAKGVQS